MNASKWLAMVCVSAAITCGGSGVWAAKQKTAAEPAPIPLSDAGEKLSARYSDLLKSLQAQIVKAIPSVDEQAKSAFVKAYHEESSAIEAERKCLLAGAKAKDKDAQAKAHEAVKAALEQATTQAQAPAKAVLAAVGSFLSSANLDAPFAKFIILTQATPRGLAEFAQQGPQQQALIEQLLSDNELMKQMVVADGAAGGKYGRAMQIYTDIQKASPKAKEGNLQRLALAVAIEHALPILQVNAIDLKDGPPTVDPVKRYQSYEKAFLNGELDPNFKDLTVWEYRNAVNGDEPDETSAWGRQMLRNYRPDQVTLKDSRWRYVESVKSEVKYGSQDVKNDLPTLQNYQNMIMNGGVCGRRAFFGRFIVRSFGIPTLARPQPGHATLVHWSPEGWVINLGANWGWGTIGGKPDVDFLPMTQARKEAADYLKVQRAQWTATALGEPVAYGFTSPAGSFWSGVALYQQRAIVEQSKAKALAAVGTDIGEANESKVKDALATVTIPAEERKITIGSDGVITIPAAATTKPTTNTEKIRFMPSNLGGMQMHYCRLGKTPEDFEYTVNAPAAGKYALTARVVTTSDKQLLMVAANDAKEPTTIAVPFTVGMWDKTPAVEVTLAKGVNTLRFSRTDPMKGLTIKDFTLTPVK